jgi:hypothetical protein
VRVKHEMFYDYGLLFLCFSLLSSIDAISMFTLALALSIATSICGCIQHERELNKLSSVSWLECILIYICASSGTLSAKQILKRVSTEVEREVTSRIFKC